MDTCVICHTEYEPCYNNEGKVLVDYETHICCKCLKKIVSGEIKVEDYDLYAIQKAEE